MGFRRGNTDCAVSIAFFKAREHSRSLESTPESSPDPVVKRAVYLERTKRIREAPHKDTACSNGILPKQTNALWQVFFAEN